MASMNQGNMKKVFSATTKVGLSNKYPEQIQWNNNGAQIQQLTTPKKVFSKVLPQRSQSQVRTKNIQQQHSQSPRMNSATMRSPQSQISTHYQSQPSSSNSLQRTPFVDNLEKEYKRKNYDNVKKYLDLAKINRRVTANDVKKLAANPLKGYNTNIKEVLTMEGIQKRIIKETELKYYDFTSQINLPISNAREEEHPHDQENGRYASQMKFLMDDASSIVNLPGSMQRIIRDVIIN